MSKKSSLVAIFKEFISQYPIHFGSLFLILVFDGIVAASSVLTLVPLADYLLDPMLQSPSRITKIVLDLIERVNIYPGFWIFGLMFVLSNLFKSIFEITTRYFILRIKYAVSRGLVDDALNTFFKARWEFFSGEDQGRLLNTFNKELNTISDTLGHLATHFALFVQFCIYLLVPLFLNVQMTLTALGLALLMGLPFLYMQKLSYSFGQHNIATANTMTGVLNEIMLAARLVLGFGRQKESLIRYLNAFDQHIHFTLRSQILTISVGSIFQPIGILSAVASLGVALKLGIPVAEMAALLWSLLRALPLLGQMLATKVAINNFLPSYEQLVNLRLKALQLQEPAGDKVFSHLNDKIELRNLSFIYPGRTQTLKGINLTIRKGQMTALVGESGSGKSTITDLVLGLQVPESGEVILDGFSLGEWNQNSFRGHVGYVPQEPFLFHTSIRENLLWSFPQGSDSDLWEACQMANADIFIKQLPEGIDTIVGDRGIRLSGGQRQRIALARALLRKPQLLILDEATSSLDSESEQLIQESINSLTHGTTILIVSHRLSTIINADQVYVLRDGEIVEAGAYSDLSCNPNGLLAGMIICQQNQKNTSG